MFRVFVFLGLLFSVVLVAGDCTLIEQECDCDINGCENLNCCDVLSNTNERRREPSKIIRTARGSSVALDCICCSCDNITCSNSVDIAQSDKDNLEALENAGIHLWHHEIPQKTYSESSSSSSSSEDLALEKPVIDGGVVRTLADHDRALLEGRVQVRGCDTVDQNCPCDIAECSELDCCVNTRRRNVEEPPQMFMRIGRGTAVLTCDCCECSNIDCDLEEA